MSKIFAHVAVVLFFVSAALGYIAMEASKVRPPQREATGILLENPYIVGDEYTAIEASVRLEDGSEMKIYVPKQERNRLAGDEVTYWVLEETGEPLRSEILWRSGVSTPVSRFFGWSAAAVALAMAVMFFASIVAKIAQIPKVRAEKKLAKAESLEWAVARRRNSDAERARDQQRMSEEANRGY